MGCGVREPLPSRAAAAHERDGGWAVDSDVVMCPLRGMIRGGSLVRPLPLLGSASRQPLVVVEPTSSLR